VSPENWLVPGAVHTQASSSDHTEFNNFYPPRDFNIDQVDQYKAHRMPPIAEMLDDPTWGYTNVDVGEDVDLGGLGDFDVNAVSAEQSSSVLLG